MHSHSTIDSTFLGLATSVRRWWHTKQTEIHTEVVLSRSGYFSVGCDLFCGQEMLMVHARLIWIWVSFSFSAQWQWLKDVREWFYGRFGKYRGREFRLSYTEAAFTWDFFAKEHESSTRDPWWMHSYLYMPWHREWVSTEILTIDMKTVVHREDRKNRRKFIDRFDEIQAIKSANSMTLPFTYTLKNGEVQRRTAKIVVDRMAHGYRWLPLPFFKRTSIWCDFDGEVGERTGSWKGGTTGCGYNVRPGESASDCFRRMEREREFK